MYIIKSFTFTTLVYIYSNSHGPNTHSRHSCVPDPDVHVFMEVVKVMVLGLPCPVEGSFCYQVVQQVQNDVSLAREENKASHNWERRMTCIFIYLYNGNWKQRRKERCPYEKPASVQTHISSEYIRNRDISTCTVNSHSHSCNRKTDSYYKRQFDSMCWNTFVIGGKTSMPQFTRVFEWLIAPMH
jgi:hypothetical protein